MHIGSNLQTFRSTEPPESPFFYLALTHEIRSAIHVRAHIILYKQTVSVSAGGQYHCLCIPTLTFWSLLFTWCTTSLTFNSCTLCPHCIYVFCIYLRKNSDFCHLLHKLIGFCNRDEKCLQRGADWGFKWSGLSWVCKGIYFSHTRERIKDT